MKKWGEDFWMMERKRIGFETHAVAPEEDQRKVWKRRWKKWLWNLIKKFGEEEKKLFVENLGFWWGETRMNWEKKKEKNWRSLVSLMFDGWWWESEVRVTGRGG